jgi:outer membrane biosynthesis protein TonB
VDNGAILEMAVERDDNAVRAGTVVAARLTRKVDASGRGLVTFADGATAQLMPVPSGLTEGSALLVNPEVDPELVRAAVEAVSKWRYRPTLLNGDPVEVDTTIMVNFKLLP